MIRSIKLSLPFLVLALLACSSADSTDDTTTPKDPIINPNAGLQIVFFTPVDVEVPDDAKARMREVVDYSQYFFKKWMAHWGYPVENPLKISRNENGDPKILFVKGKNTLASGAYDKLGYAKTEVIPAALEKYGLLPENQTWWIFSYPGPEKRAFRGGGTFKGGTSSANFTSGLGTLIEIGDDELAKGKAAEFKLKAVIHELGHALGMGHMGPHEDDGLGNSLMGPVNNAYHKKFPEDDRVYMPKAEAALLWKHPLFAGSFDKVHQSPTVALEGFKAEYEATLDEITITGTLKSDSKAHSVVIQNKDSQTKEYWRKAYSARIKSDGSFEIKIKNPNKTNGQIKIAFCFNNGAISGTTGEFGLNKGLTKSYTYSNNDFQF
ncbi:zinc metalloprotease [Sediminicola luteus]|uniref:Peptidase metallopeptidase domain-containing protein n=1 Tax=Sediminicola luteus TaxID=319238 RepID=A0A2A4GE63_9FLAO|nr:hypothetical protein [Sediminicola luteus]PCE66701.1 hypothetical protein B7P33_05265 [Sediminicola luteus]